MLQYFVDGLINIGNRGLQVIHAFPVVRHGQVDIAVILQKAGDVIDRDPQLFSHLLEFRERQIDVRVPEQAQDIIVTFHVIIVAAKDFDNEPMVELFHVLAQFSLLVG